MAKLALCIKRTSAPMAYQQSEKLALISIPEGFFDTPTERVDRAICETDESWQQLVPYIVLNDQDERIFCYSRGKAGQEDRLHAKLSIGLGGHVDSMPNQIGELLQLLKEEAARELREEVSVLHHPSRFEFESLICDPTDPVGRVHLGLLTGAQVNPLSSIAMKLEEGSIEDGCFLKVERLRSPEIYNRLENWSKVVVDSM